VDCHGNVLGGTHSRGDSPATPGARHATGECVLGWASKSEYDRYLRSRFGRAPWIEPAGIPCLLHKDEAIARDHPIRIAFASFHGARGLTLAFKTSHALSVVGLVPCNAGRPLASQCVRDREENVDPMGEAEQPGRIHSRWRALASPEFLARLAVGRDPSCGRTSV
jgi:hypothetical protein